MQIGNVNPGVGTIIYAYDNTIESATTRNLLVNVYMEHVWPKWLTKELPKEFLYLVVEGLMRKRVSSVKAIKGSDIPY